MSDTKTEELISAGCKKGCGKVMPEVRIWYQQFSKECKKVISEMEIWYRQIGKERGRVIPEMRI